MGLQLKKIGQIPASLGGSVASQKEKPYLNPHVQVLDCYNINRIIYTDYIYYIYHSAGKHDRGPLFLHYFQLDSSEVIQLVQFKFKIL